MLLKGAGSRASLVVEDEAGRVLALLEQIGKVRARPVAQPRERALEQRERVRGHVRAREQRRAGDVRERTRGLLPDRRAAPRGTEQAELGRGEGGPRLGEGERIERLELRCSEVRELRGRMEKSGIKVLGGHGM